MVSHFVGPAGRAKILILNRAAASAHMAHAQIEKSFALRPEWQGRAREPVGGNVLAAIDALLDVVAALK
jgi:hypothetical protein